MKVATHIDIFWEKKNICDVNVKKKVSSKGYLWSSRRGKWTFVSECGSFKKSEKLRFVKNTKASWIFSS